MSALSSPAVRFGVVGLGWRSEFFLRLARLLPDELELTGIAVRRPAAAERAGAEWGVPIFDSPEELVRTGRPQFVITALPWTVNPEVIGTVVGLGCRVLSETPPAPDIAGLHRLWDQVGAGGQVQVAEQYLRLPGHAARSALLQRGVIGEPTSVQVSSTHTYHAIAMMRGLLGARTAPATVSARRFQAPLVDPLTRAGWTHDEQPKPAGTVIATLEFPAGTGLYDFTDNQWHNQLRHRRIVIRGSRGEIADDDVVYLAGPEAILRSKLIRSQLGHDLNLDGYDTEHISFNGEIVFRNPMLGHRLMDEEIAIASVLRDTARWSVDEGPAPYPLAEACHDHRLGLAIDESVATGQDVRVDTEPWMAQLGPRA
ncbi:Gfo/Idh/MocA family oxidoreductase [Jatrophihabitans telluris]|uniref:Gfo/Idh/MocA family oxidoreductase n=1 Tax=Jatrophihabitans telluris TaxID=2038343 RepID=A0ABY4R134_9ACTN|nr:Gfo/Idh/MocA family oxidoreductase [Jatrophihabitans telluris]UQX89425.1 Gfo/Idh/MocA family oxidoreductase [Jatrophihabitans telluris]